MHRNAGKERKRNIKMCQKDADTNWSCERKKKLHVFSFNQGVPPMLQGFES